MGISPGQPVNQLPRFEEFPVVEVMLDENGGSVLERLVIGRDHTYFFQSAELPRGIFRGRVLGEWNIRLFCPELGVAAARLLEDLGKGLEGHLDVAGVLGNDLLQVEVACLDVAGLVGFCCQFAEFFITTLRRQGGKGEPDAGKSCWSAKIHPGNSTPGWAASQSKKRLKEGHKGMRREIIEPPRGRKSGLAPAPEPLVPVSPVIVLDELIGPGTVGGLQIPVIPLELLAGAEGDIAEKDRFA